MIIVFFFFLSLSNNNYKIKIHNFLQMKWVGTWAAILRMPWVLKCCWGTQEIECIDRNANITIVNTAL